MKIYSDIDLNHFEFWSGAVSRIDVMTEEQLSQMEAVIEELYPDGIEDVQLNDIFWHDSDWVADVLGFKDFETLEKFNEEGQKYIAYLYPKGENRIYLYEDDDQYSVESWIDDNMDNKYIAKYKGTGASIEIVSNLDEGDSYEYITLDGEDEL